MNVLQLLPALNVGGVERGIRQGRHEGVGASCYQREHKAGTSEADQELPGSHSALSPHTAGSSPGAAPRCPTERWPQGAAVTQNV